MRQLRQRLKQAEGTVLLRPYRKAWQVVLHVDVVTRSHIDILTQPRELPIHNQKKIGELIVPLPTRGEIKEGELVLANQRLFFAFPSIDLGGELVLKQGLAGCESVEIVSPVAACARRQSSPPAAQPQLAAPQ